MLLFFLVFYKFCNFSFVRKYEIKCCIKKNSATEKILDDSANVNQSKKWAVDVLKKVCIRLSFRFALPAGMLFMSLISGHPTLDSFNVLL